MDVDYNVTAAEEVLDSSAPMRAQEVIDESSSVLKVCPSHQDPRAWSLVEDTPGNRSLVADTGAARHCIPFDALTAAEQETMIDLDQLVPLFTANGEIVAAQSVQVFLNDW